jgi:hypothetical protein
MAKIDKILGSISPMYGAVSGQGLFGNALGGLGDVLGPTSGVLPAIASEQRKSLRKRRAASEGSDGGEGMKRGGAVKKMAKGGSASKRGDGIATKGKTKGRFV